LYIYIMSTAPNKTKLPMRRIFIFSTLLFLFSLQLNAQNRFHAGLSACAAITDVQGTDPFDADVDFHHLGFSVGGIVHTQLQDGNSFQFEINYITKGSSQLPDSANNGAYKLTLNYVEVPIVFRHQLGFNVNKKSMSKFEIEFGASAGALVHYGETVNNYAQTFGKENVHKVDLSILLGFNYVLSQHIYFGFRYSNSVIPALRRNSIPTYFLRFAFNNGNNMVGQLGIHFIFGKMDTENVPPAQ